MNIVTRSYPGGRGFSALMSALLISCLVLAGCGATEVRIVCPTGFRGSFRILHDDRAPSVKPSGGVFVVALDANGEARLNKRDFDSFRTPHQLSFQESDGTFIRVIKSDAERSFPNRWGLFHGSKSIQEENKATREWYFGEIGPLRGGYRRD